MNQSKRKIIPDEQTIVVLDTSPVRNIAYAVTTPAWVATFAQMAENGYAFSLADGALAELLAQYIRGSITDADLEKMLAAVSQFLHPDVPILPGKRDVLAMIGQSKEADWSEDQVRDFALRGWAALNDPSLLDEEQRVKLREALQFDRDEWIRWFETFDDSYAKWVEEKPGIEEKQPLNQYRHDLLDKNFSDLASCSHNLHPDLATRQDLELRYIWRQWVRTRQKKDGYDPTNPKKVNDGIDLDLYLYLTLPALVVADERGFHERLVDIESPQREWFWKPQDLADAWARGERPRPVWVAPVTEPQETQNAN